MSRDLRLVTQRWRVLTSWLFPVSQMQTGSRFLVFIPNISPGNCVSITTASLLPPQHHYDYIMSHKGFRSSGPDSPTHPGLKVMFSTHVNTMPHVTDRPVAGNCGLQRFKRENICGAYRSEGKLSVQPDVDPACCSPSGGGVGGGECCVSVKPAVL